MARMALQFGPDAGQTLWEYALYGILNSILVSQFPPQGHFLVKPQGIFRTLLGAGVPPQNQHRTPYCGHGTAPEAHNPDFIIAKSGNSVYRDFIIAIVEVKAMGTSFPAAAVQLEGYLERAAKEPFVAGKLYGFLVIHNRVYIYHYNTWMDRQIQQGVAQPFAVTNTFEGVIDTVSEEFLQRLYAVSVRFHTPKNNTWYDPNH